MKTKKKRIFILIIALFVFLSISFIYLDNHVYTPPAQLEDAVHQELINSSTNNYKKNDFIAEGHTLFGFTQSFDTITIYGYAHVSRFNLDKSNQLVDMGGFNGPISIKFKYVNDSYYDVIENWVPKSGDEYVKSIKERFPITMWSRVFAIGRYDKKHDEKIQKQCNEFLTSSPF